MFASFWLNSFCFCEDLFDRTMLGMQPPTAYETPTYTHLMHSATAPFTNESLLNGPLAPVTLLTSKGPANLLNADKESCAGVSEESEDKSEAEDKGHSGYTFFGVDLTPVLPAALAVSTVVGGLCMLLVQIPMLSRFTTLSEVWLLAPLAVLYGIVLGCMACLVFFWMTLLVGKRC